MVIMEEYALWLYEVTECYKWLLVPFFIESLDAFIVWQVFLPIYKITYAYV